MSTTDPKAKPPQTEEEKKQDAASDFPDAPPKPGSHEESKGEVGDPRQR